MYKVVEISINPYMFRQRFASALISDCWEFMKRQKKFEGLYVVDKVGTFYDPPEDVRVLKNYYKMVG